MTTDKDMTRKLSANARCSAAKGVYELLRTCGVADYLFYDGKYAIVARKDDPVCAGHVCVYFDTRGVEITFPDPDGGIPLTVTITAPNMLGAETPDLLGAIAVIVEGLLMATGQRPSPSTADGPYCHHRPMYEDTPKVWFFPGGPVEVELVYRCAVCYGCDHVEVLDRDEANRIVAHWGIAHPLITAGGDQ